MDAVTPQRKAGRVRSRRRRTARGVFAIALASVLVGALFTAATASAASRGFKIENKSNKDLRLEAVKSVPRVQCVGGRCVPSFYPIDFEGRPANGSVLNPGQTDTFELQYSFSITGGLQYAASVQYRILGTDDVVEFRLETWSTVNESDCIVHGTTKFGCTAAGLNLSFKNSGPDS